MLPGPVRFLLLFVFVFITACAGDAAPPQLVTNNDIRPEQDASVPNDVRVDDINPPGGDDTEVHDDATITDDATVVDDAQNDTEVPEDTDQPTPPCTAHTDCTGAELCIPQANSDELKCAVPKSCTANTDCTAPQICAFDYTLDTLRTVCLEPAGPGELGAFCTDNAQCASNLCLNEQCATTCARPVDCSEDGSFLCKPEEIAHGNSTKTVNVCTPKPPTQCASDNDCSRPERCLIKATANGPAFMCSHPPTNSQEPGTACTINADCASNLCLDNVCTAPCAADNHCHVDADQSCEAIAINHNGQPANVSVCQPPVQCNRNAECLLSEVCYIKKTSTEVKTQCKKPNTGGANPVGANCTTDESCASNLCLQDRFRKHCAPACTTDADCAAPGSPVQYECKSTNFTLTNGSDSAKICVAKAPPTCSSQLACAAGTHCAVVTNTNNNGLETVCIPLTGGGAPGASCSNNTQCNGQLCLSGKCSQPCTARDQCGSQQLCRTNNVQKDGFTKSLQVCETPATVPCTSNAQCTDGVRICGETRTSGGVTKGYCNFPNPGGAPTGASCTADNQCHSDYCLPFTNQCTLLCTNNGQCGGGNEICTTYSGNGMCATSCTNNSSCKAGQSCTVNANVNTNSFDYVCEKHAGPGQLGYLASTPGDCQSGLVVSRGSGPTYCSAICNPGNGNNDCSNGIPDNTLTNCEQIALAGDGFTQNIWACVMP